MANDFGTAKSVFILAIVAGCFAVLWPNVFYPMITGDYQIKSDSHSSGCCDVIFDSDVNGIKIMTELCEKILTGENANNQTLISLTQGKLSKDSIDLCKRTVMERCNLDITELITPNSALTKHYKQTLDLLRTLNSSICFKQNFAISLGQIGLPRPMRIWGLNISKHMKPERPPHLHPELMHPALREKGRAIQQTKKVSPQPRAVGAGVGAGTAAAAAAAAVPIPGMRPTLGGAGHVVPPPKGGGTMGIVMPMYTIGIVIFFLYTMLKLMFKKTADGQSYDDLTSDADFQRDVFGYNQEYRDRSASDATKLGDTELEMLKERLQETEKAMERIVAKMMSLPNQSSAKETSESGKKADKSYESCESADERDRTETESERDDAESEGESDGKTGGSGGVKVVGMETTRTGGGKGEWNSAEETRRPRSEMEAPHNIYIPLSPLLPPPHRSNIIVTDSSTETIKSSRDNAPVVLSGKVTLSLIGIQETGLVDSSGDEKVTQTGDSKVISEEANTSSREDDNADRSRIDVEVNV